MSQGDLAYLELKNFDELFREDPDAKIIPCGAEASVQKDLMKAQIETFFHDGSKELTNISSCECGYLSGNFWEGTKTICPKCHTEVKTNFADELKFKTWLEIPDYLPPLLHPVAYGVLDNWLGSFKKAGRILPTLLNVRANLPQGMEVIMQQGMTYFYDHFWDIINWFATQYKKFQTPSERKKTDLVLQFLDKFKDRLFFRHIPILNSSLHLLTKSGTMNFADTVVKYIVQAKIDLNNLIFMIHHSTYTNNLVESRMYDIYTSMLDYTNNIMSCKLLKKPGFIRKQLLGARLHCTARAVIVPIPGIHQADEVYLPWLEAIALFNLEIMNVLMNRERLTLPEALKRMTWAIARFDPDIHRILTTLIEECPYKGLPMIIGRNPSLRHGAMFLLYATRIKTEYEDVTLSISPLIASAPNLIDDRATYRKRWADKSFELLEATSNPLRPKALFSYSMGRETECDIAAERQKESKRMDEPWRNPKAFKGMENQQRNRPGSSPGGTFDGHRLKRRVGPSGPKRRIPKP